MKIWLLEDGERTGPHESFLIRERIDHGELNGDTLCWFENANDWMPLREAALFESLFKKPLIEEEPPPLPTQFSAPPLFLGRRFWARWFDYHVYFCLWGIILRLSGADIFSIMMSPWAPFMLFLPWVLLEAAMTHCWKITPGKWLFQLQLNGEFTLLKASLRSLRVWILGIGMGLFPINAITQAFSWFFTKKYGAALWDIRSGTSVSASPLSQGRRTLCILAFILVVILQGVIFFPYTQKLMRESLSPEQWEQIAPMFQPPAQ